VSPSGTGIHIIIRGKLPDGFRNKQSMVNQGFKALEVYDHSRYFTMTGIPLEEASRISEVNLSKFQFGESKTQKKDGQSHKPVESFNSVEEDRIIEQLASGKQGIKFNALYYRGDLSFKNDDHSLSDYELT
tara:strand:- start:6104 stop:6496 length:393 start_codon:yes stop_codon:yes gene_type:complete